MLLARALQLFMPGKPQIWYLDLFAGKNDYEAVKHAGPGGHKEINRTNLSSGQIEAMLKRAVVAQQLQLLQMRSRYKAFSADAFITVQSDTAHMVFAWQAAGQNGDRPVPHTGLHHPHGGTGLPDLLRPGGGGRVIVVGRPAHQPVPDAASHQDGPVSRSVQPLQHRQRPQVPSLHLHSYSPESPGLPLSYSSRVCPG